MSKRKEKIDFNNEALEIIQSNSFLFYLYAYIRSIWKTLTHCNEKKIKSRKIQTDTFLFGFSLFFSINDKYLYSPRFV